MNLPAPIPLADPREDIVPHKYIAIQRLQHCTCCKAQHESSDLYAWTPLRSEWNRGKPVSNLRRLVYPEYRLPIEQVLANKTDLIPFCHKCYHPSLMNTPHLKDPPPVDSQKILRMPPTQPVAQSAKPKASTTKSKKATTDSLMEMLK